MSYELANGPIADGMTVDHLCRNKRCVRPEHLEAVTRGDNVRRWAATITHCPQGHEYSAENTRVWKGKRNCITCQREAKRRAA
ncbi:HNH endonuclease signature motif containing protein [Luteipulveratus halotolerans]|uniref:HNH endonuclease signature motif containing protein n=1 Tax=Luteipulveratus halotolerans TaxID=1631356 RepID=UPI0038B2BFF1